MDSDEELLDSYDGDSGEDYYYSGGDSDMGDFIAGVDDDDEDNDADYGYASDENAHVEVRFSFSAF